MAKSPSKLSDPAWLFAAYRGRPASLRELAQELGCSHQTVANALKRAGITPRQQGRRLRHPGDTRLADTSFLHCAYVERGQTVREIANDLDCDPATVWRALVRHGIDTRRSGPRPGGGRHG